MEEPVLILTSKIARMAQVIAAEGTEIDRRNRSSSSLDEFS